MQLPYLTSRKSLDDATDLIAQFGTSAGLEAQLRADASREKGNHIHFCHWRQIERLIVLMTIDQPIGTIH